MHKQSREASVMPERRTIGVLYGFRALMILIVCHYHIWQQSWLSQYFWLGSFRLDLDFLARAGYMFVDGMILMSGFLLYLPYAREKMEGPAVPPLKRYFQNRAARILPSYLFAITLALFFIAIPQSKYASSAAMTKDIVTHLTFTFTFWRDTCLHTPLNGALWTVAVEVQFYLIFPLLARGVQKKPVITLGTMGLAGILYRLFVYTQAGDTALYLNQMPSFLDVYALGMLGAILYEKALCFLEKNKDNDMGRIFSWVCAGVFALSLMGIAGLLRVQASASGHEAIRLSQLLLRLPFALIMLWSMLSAALMPRFLQKILDNRLLRFFATISFNLYIWHQLLAVQIRLAFYNDSLHSDPKQQVAYTLLCFGAAVLCAMTATYGIEQPCARRMQALFGRAGQKRA